jgi:hypothetical protein
MSSKTTWKPHTEHGKLTSQSELPDSVFAFPKQRKEPLTDASHVRNALARFDQVEGSRFGVREYKESRGVLWCRSA